MINYCKIASRQSPVASRQSPVASRQSPVGEISIAKKFGVVNCKNLNTLTNIYL